MQVKSIAEVEHSAILSTFIKLPFEIKIFVLSMFLSGHFTQVLYMREVPKSHNLAYGFQLQQKELAFSYEKN